MELYTDKLREECGVFGMYAPRGNDVAKDIYYGLIALQHRGQESAGISVTDTTGKRGNVSIKKGMGLVSEVFGEEDLIRLKGNIGVGHVRYSTTGGSLPENAQPISMNYIKGSLSLVHNGNIINAEELKTQQMHRGQAHYTSSDSEMIAYEIISERLKSASIEEAVQAAAKRITGGYALIVMSPKKLVVMRDPLGIKPLVLGKRQDTYIAASESSAIEAVGGSLIRDIRPGEILTISQSGIKSDVSLYKGKRAHCIFEYIYFARSDSIIDGVPVREARWFAGQALAKEETVKADIVCGVPDSGMIAAEGYAQESGLPLTLVFHKNSYVGRSFIKPTDDQRRRAVNTKLSVNASAVSGKRIILIDDSIVRGITMRQIVTMLKKAGAAQVHVRISSPPFLYPCFYGTDVPSSKQLIASHHSNQDVKEWIKADSLAYLKQDAFKAMVGNLPLCAACFNNNYPI